MELPLKQAPSEGPTWPCPAQSRTCSAGVADHQGRPADRVAVMVMMTSPQLLLGLISQVHRRKHQGGGRDGPSATTIHVDRHECSKVGLLS